MTPAGLLGEMQRVAERGDVASFLRYARSVHPSELSDVLAQLDDELQLRVVQAPPPELISEALAEMEVGEHPEDLLAALRPEQAAGIVSQLEMDDAADLIGDLPHDAARRILSHVAVADRAARGRHRGLVRPPVAREAGRGSRHRQLDVRHRVHRHRGPPAVARAWEPGPGGGRMTGLPRLSAAVTFRA